METNDLMKSCVCCSNSYVDDEYNEIVCKITGGFCTPDLTADTYSTCEDFNQIRPLFRKEK